VAIADLILLFLLGGKDQDVNNTPY